mmetsp:Transcript_40610/g.72689  ORF Transcript_40610/g.72689 Transcript_40610/m.72689 type:complete len:378 (-) Transcript_40610:3375-4508(-)
MVCSDHQGDHIAVDALVDAEPVGLGLGPGGRPLEDAELGVGALREDQGLELAPPDVHLVVLALDPEGLVVHDDLGGDPVAAAHVDGRLPGGDDAQQLLVDAGVDEHVAGVAGDGGPTATSDPDTQQLIDVVGGGLARRLLPDRNPRPGSGRGHLPDIGQGTEGHQLTGHLHLPHLHAARLGGQAEVAIVQDVGRTGLVDVRVRDPTGRLRGRRDGWFRCQGRSAGGLLWGLLWGLRCRGLGFRGRGGVGGLQGQRDVGREPNRRAAPGGIPLSGLLGGYWAAPHGDQPHPVALDLELWGLGAGVIRRDDDAGGGADRPAGDSVDCDGRVLKADAVPDLLVGQRQAATAGPGHLELRAGRVHHEPPPDGPPLRDAAHV